MAASSETIKVLLIDDDKDDYIITRDLFSMVRNSHYELDWAPSYKEGLAVVSLGKHHVCLVDYMLDQGTGVDLIRQVRAARLRTPMILLTGVGDYDVDIEAMGAGATHYLVKGEISPTRLDRTIRYAVQLNIERSLGEAALAAFAEKHAVVAEIGRRALAGGELQELFNEAAILVAKTLGVEYCELLELLPDGDSLILRAGVGWKKEYAIGQATVSAGKASQAGFTLLSDEPVRVADLRTETRFSGTPLLLEHGVVSGMSVVIRGQDRPYGVLGAHTTLAGTFSTDDANFLRSVAHVLAEAIGRKQSELRLRQSEARFRRVVESNMLGIVFWDLNGKIAEANDAFLDMVGYSREDLAADRLRCPAMTPPEYHALDKKALAEIATSGICNSYEKELIRKDGSRVSILLGSATLDREHPTGVAFVLDITERRLLEEQLRQSQKLEAVGQLAGGVAHDFNNLLTVIKGYGEISMRKLNRRDPLWQNLQEITKAGDRAAALTRQLLAFSRKQVLQPKILDLNATVSEMEKMLRRLIGEDIDLRTVLASELDSVKADPGQIEQVLMNLAVNARDAMPRGGKLTIDTSNVVLTEEYASHHVGAAPGSYVLLAVSDTGVGMDEKTQERIFEPFYTTKEAGKGTGLGLSTVYGIVKQSGGSIWVYSEVGQGTSFKIYLPRVDESAESYQQGAPLNEMLDGSETILVCEDEEMVRMLARQTLEMYGYHVLDAANGGAAFLICEHHSEPIHLLLTDVVMPEMSGPKLAGRLHQLRPEMKVLFMSGYTDDAIVHQGILDPGTNFLQKPFSTAALARKVRGVLDA